MNTIQFAFRNVFRNTRRSLITLLAIAVGFMAINVFGGYVALIFDAMGDAAIYGESLGHLTIFKKGFLVEGKIEPEKYMITAEEMQAISALVAQNPSVKKVLPKMSVSGLISNGSSSTIFIADGIHPDDKAFLDHGSSYDSEYDGEGTPITAQAPTGVQLGSDLANMLNLKVGDTLPVMANTLTGQMNALDVDVVGIYNTGSDATNDKYLLMPLELAQSLYDTTSVDRVSLALSNTKETEPVRKWLVEQLPAIGFDAEVKSWNELSLFYTQVRDMFSVIFLFIFCIVLIIVVTSVINTMSMSVVERTQEIGTLRALGLKRRDVLRIFGAEGFVIGLIGTIAGLAGTLLIIWLFETVDVTYIPPGSTEPVPMLVGFVPSMLAISGLFLAFLSWGAAIFPSFKASRLRIVDAFGHV